MRHHSHTTISILRRGIEVWRRRERWSRETVTQQVVECFERMKGEEVTGIHFDPETRDPVERMKVNADRLYRWLDDETKDRNLLPPNMLPFVMASLPVDLRIQCAAELLLPTGLSVHVLGNEGAIDIVNALQAVAKESGEATSAIAALVDGETPEELANAKRELVEQQAAVQRALNLVESRQAATTPQPSHGFVAVK